MALPCSPSCVSGAPHDQETKTPISCEMNSNLPLARQLGIWFDEMGKSTSSGRWILFITITYRTPDFPWQQGFHSTFVSKPSPYYASHLFQCLVKHLEVEIGSAVDFIVADQYGKRNGRFHQHALLAGDGLATVPVRQISAWLNEHAGYNRVLPFKSGAAYYISRFIGSAVGDAAWDVQIGGIPESRLRPTYKSGVEIVTTPEISHEALHQTLVNRRR